MDAAEAGPSSSLQPEQQQQMQQLQQQQHMQQGVAAGGSGAGPSTDLVPAEPQAPTVDLTKHPSGIVPVLQNIVATANLDTRLDLKSIALHARNAEYNPKVGPKFQLLQGVRKEQPKQGL